MGTVALPPFAKTDGSCAEERCIKPAEGVIEDRHTPQPRQFRVCKQHLLRARHGAWMTLHWYDGLTLAFPSGGLHEAIDAA